MVGWFILVAVYLASSGEKQYQVTMHEGDTTTCTGKGFQQKEYFRTMKRPTEKTMSKKKEMIVHKV